MIASILYLVDPLPEDPHAEALGEVILVPQEDGR